MEVVLWSLVILVARVVDVSMGTIRVQMIVRGRKVLAAVIGFVEVLIFILVVSRVIQGVDNWLYVLAYAGGFGSGTLVGGWLSERMSRDLTEVTVISRAWEGVERAVRAAGFALTRYLGVGRAGPVEVLSVICPARHLPRLTRIVSEVDPQAFLYTQPLTGLRGGYIYGLKGKL